MKSLFSKNEINKIESAITKDRVHPTKLILNRYDSCKNLYDKTNTAFQLVAAHNFKWLKDQKDRLLDTDDYTTSSSCLAEIRSYGTLLSLGLNIEPITPKQDNSTPDFIVKYNEESVIVEVNAKQYDNSESDKIENFYEIKDTIKARKTIIKEIEITPFGKPKINENTTENVIHKLCQIKNDEKQFSHTTPSILWIDLQDIQWQLCLKKELSLSLATFNGKLHSGEIWYAMYGKKGLPIYEKNNFTKKNILFMRHDGRFSQNNESKIDAIIFSLEDNTVVFENPYTNKPIPKWFWNKFIKLQNFKLEYSYINWPDYKIITRINYDTKKIKEIYKIIKNNSK